jgi:hypothetical protein
VTRKNPPSSLYETELIALASGPAEAVQAVPKGTLSGTPDFAEKLVEQLENRRRCFQQVRF